MTGSHGGGPVDRAGTEAAMGARHGDDGGADRAVPRTAGRATPGAEGLLAAALRDERVGAEGERRAVAAFRTARDAQPGRAARTRRRDDWRPRERCRARRSSRAALSVLLASLTLGGVAYAAIGGSGSAPDTEAGCRAYERLEGRGKALDAAVWQRLVAAAGGEEGVAAHCAAQRARQASPSTASDPAEPGRAGIPAGPGRSKGDADGGGKGTGAEKKAQRADRAPGGDA